MTQQLPIDDVTGVEMAARQRAITSIGSALQRWGQTDSDPQNLVESLHASTAVLIGRLVAAVPDLMPLVLLHYESTHYRCPDTGVLFNEFGVQIDENKTS